MKKIVAIILGALMCLSLAACGSSSATTTAATTAVAATEAVTEAEETVDESAVAEVVSEVADVVAEEDNQYAGKQFSGKDPWGGELAVTVRTFENDKMDWTFTMTSGDTILYQEVTGTEMKDNKGSFKVSGEVEQESGSTNKQTFEYSGTIELKDGNVVVTFEDGALTSSNETGGGSAWQVKALSDGANVVTLEPNESK